jgi:hypothetical protein
MYFVLCIVLDLIPWRQRRGESKTDKETRSPANTEMLAKAKLIGSSWHIREKGFVL